jgi:hypothetical protein
VAAVIGAGGSIAATKMASDAQKKAAKRAAKNQYAFSDAQRKAIQMQLMRAVMSSAPPGMGAPPAGVAGQAGQAGAAGNPFEADINEWVQTVMAKYMEPSPAYQGFLASLQERRDARSGVPGVPPQGAASPSAQRRTTSGGGGRSY